MNRRNNRLATRSKLSRNIKELLGWAVIALAMYIIAYAYLLETN